MFATIAFGHGAASSPSIIISIIIITSPSPRNAEQGVPPFRWQDAPPNKSSFRPFFFFLLFLPLCLPPSLFRMKPNVGGEGNTLSCTHTQTHTTSHLLKARTQHRHELPNAPFFSRSFALFPYAFPVCFSLFFYIFFCSSSFCFTHTHAHTRRFALPEFTSTVLRMLPGRGRPVRPGSWWPFSTGRLTSAPEPYGFCGYAAPLSAVAGRAAVLHCQGAATQQRNA